MSEHVWVSYLELTSTPAAPAAHSGKERIERERLDVAAYLDLYRRVGGPWRWDRRLTQGAATLAPLLVGERLDTYVLRDRAGEALGWCEFDRRDAPTLELTHFGLIPQAQGRRLGPWLLATSLAGAWNTGAQRIWLHTDTWDHPAALRCYERAGFRLYARRYEPADNL